MICNNFFISICSGLDNAGKSSVLNKWLNSTATVSPTFGFQIKTLKLSDRCNLNFWDIGGQKSIRPFWRNYFEETDAIVWVIDSADASRLGDCRRELESVLTADVTNDRFSPLCLSFHFLEIEWGFRIDFSK